ncbi:transposase [Vibrio crassostreae]|nr:transposase [Vibrio crassostreae]CAK3515641.1 transposase [Vibrio crassostreae]CAK3912613.1 transposase [Vibrio crassostreae]
MKFESSIQSLSILSNYRGEQENDAANAQAICEAVQRPHMRFISVKSEKQQSIQCLRRTMQGLNEERAAVCNRGLLSEFGVIIPLSPEQLRSEFEVMKVHLSALATTYIDELFFHMDNIERQILNDDSQRFSLCYRRW